MSLLRRLFPKEGDRHPDGRVWVPMKRYDFSSGVVVSCGKWIKDDVARLLLVEPDLQARALALDDALSAVFREEEWDRKKVAELLKHHLVDAMRKIEQ